MMPRRAKTLGYAMSLVGILATLAGAAVMTCTQEQQTILSSPGGGQAVRKDCVMARGAHGQEASVLVVNAKVGDRFDCVVMEGKVVCK